jgi:hypothetical protein
MLRIMDDAGPFEPIMEEARARLERALENV